MYFITSAIIRFWMQMDGASMYTYGAVLIFQGFHAVFNISWMILAPVQVALLIAMPLVRPKITVDSELINSGQLIVVVLLATILVLVRLYKIINHGTARGKRDHLPCWGTFFSILWQSVRIVSIAFVPAILSGFATIVWMQDMEKKWCNPDSAMQWHGVWHCFTGFSSVYLWLFYDFNKLKDILASSGREHLPAIRSDDTKTKIKQCSSFLSLVGTTELLEPSNESDSVRADLGSPGNDADSFARRGSPLGA
ncbi:MAG: hypothetical protein SGARI_001128 [Bacillariaceae sp.]